MSVYVDDMRAGYGRMVVCHMIADTPAELRVMARAVGVAQKWIHHPGTHREHFDICLAKRKLAVAAGAIEITQRELAKMISNRGESYNKNDGEAVRAGSSKESSDEVLGSSRNPSAAVGEHPVRNRERAGVPSQPSAENLTWRDLQDSLRHLRAAERHANTPALFDFVAEETATEGGPA